MNLQWFVLVFCLFLRKIHCLGVSLPIVRVSIPLNGTETGPRDRQSDCDLDLKKPREIKQIIKRSGILSMKRSQVQAATVFLFSQVFHVAGAVS